VLSRQLSLLREVQSFRLLSLATVGSAFGTWLAFVALTIDVYDRTGSAVWVSALLIADFLPAIVIGLAAGTLVDRLPRRRLMIASDLVRVAIFAALPFANDAGAIVVLAAVAGFATGFFRPALYAGLPNLLDDKDLPHANSLLQTIENLAWALGPVIGGVLVAATGPDAAYWINAVTFLVSAALLAGIPDRLLQAAPAVGRGYWRDIADGFALVKSSRALLTVLTTWNVIMLASAGVNVAEIVLAKDAFGAGDFGYGLLVGATGLGLALGSLLAGSLLEHRAIATVYATSIGLVAVGMVGAAASPNVWVAAFCVVVLGIGNGSAVVCNALLVQRGAPDELRGRAFTLLMSSNYVVLGLGIVAAGPLTDELGPRTVWAISGALAAVAAIVGLALGRGVAPHTAPAPERPRQAERAETARL
jgi:MFS family permease